jgi:hypothetical protein
MSWTNRSILHHPECRRSMGLRKDQVAFEG